MSDQIQNEIERALNRLRDTQSALAQAQQELAEVSITSTAKGRALTVTVDSRGDVTEVTFPTSAYRSMAPAELGAVLVETIRAARTEASQAAIEAFTPLLPDGLPLAEMLSGAPDLDAMIDDAIRTAGSTFPDDPDLAPAGTTPGSRL